MSISRPHFRREGVCIFRPEQRGVGGGDLRDYYTCLGLRPGCCLDGSHAIDRNCYTACKSPLLSAASNADASMSMATWRSSIVGHPTATSAIPTAGRTSSVNFIVNRSARWVFRPFHPLIEPRRFRSEGDRICASRWRNSRAHHKHRQGFRRAHRSDEVLKILRATITDKRAWK